MSFVDRFLEGLDRRAERPVVTEVHGERLVPTTGRELSDLVARARGTLRARGVGAGDRVALLAPNSARWVAADVAVLAEGAVAVPLYHRQAASDLVWMLRDHEPALVVVPDDKLAAAHGPSEPIREGWPDAPLVDDETLFAGEPALEPAHPREPDDPATIVYTSGTSGEPKGVVLTTGNVDFMLPVIREAIEELMAHAGGQAAGAAGQAAGAAGQAGGAAGQGGGAAGQGEVGRTEHRVFHYLPFAFAGSRMVLWMCLHRHNGIHLSTDLNDLARELRVARPNYVLNVPTLLERIKSGVEAKMRDRPAPLRALWDRARAAYRAENGEAGALDRAALALARRLIFPKIRAQIGEELACLICGSAPLAEGTQRWFEMIGLPVYQVYGLTETTAIVSLDRPGEVVPGRVGRPIPGIETRRSEDGELLVRGPNVFAGYWGRPEQTRESFVADDPGGDGQGGDGQGGDGQGGDGQGGDWYRTGDEVDVDDAGRLRVIGRVKNVLVPETGHNVAPEPIEERILEEVEGAEQAVVVGHGRPYLTALVAGEGIDRDRVRAGLERINAELPHYRRVRDAAVADEPFSYDNGLMTANQKLRRRAIEEHYAETLEAMYS